MSTEELKAIKDIGFQLKELNKTLRDILQPRKKKIMELPIEEEIINQIKISEK